MSATDDIIANSEKSTDEASEKAVETLTQNIDEIHLKSSDDGDELVTSIVKIEAERSPHPLIVYTRKDLLLLSRSPLVKPPDGMPSFKNWFGETNEQYLLSNKKEAESSNGNNNGREKRYRRDAEDGDAPSRPQFRSGLSQPSQMGNFKHQPLRGNDRDRETERDLRSLSDKFDRERGRGDRLGLPSHSTLLRNRDRDTAPHLVPARESGKKRNGESSEDWRRGAEPLRGARDEHHSRRDRDDRERPRSKVRESSRQRGSPPATRRDREERERTDRRERDRDRERFPESEEDPRRWREDGKRDERLTSRREKDRLDKDKDRERSRDVLERDADRDRDARDGWTIADERDTRNLKRNHRERRYAPGSVEEERREREKEKEPAWMDAYVPPASSSGGILGGKNADGEIDSIQAWKKDMKERELKAKGLASDQNAVPEQADQKPGNQTDSTSQEAPLDEIQMFKLMMKQEEQKKLAAKSDAEENIVPPKPPRQLTESTLPGFLRVRGDRPITETQPIGPALPDLPSISSSHDALLPSSKTAPAIPDVSTSSSNDSLAIGKIQPTKSSPDYSIAGMSSTSLAPSALSVQASISSQSIQPAITPINRADSTGPRLLSTKSAATTPVEPSSRDTTSPSVPFDPPRQSRLLAFGAQNPRNQAQAPPPNLPAPVANNRIPLSLETIWPGHRSTSSPAFNQSGVHQPGMDRLNGPQAQFLSQHESYTGIDSITRPPAQIHSGNQEAMILEKLRMNAALDDGRDQMNFSPETMRSAGNPYNDRGNGFQQLPDNIHQVHDPRGRNGTPPTSVSFGMTSPISPFDGQNVSSTYSTGKGSRMAKHFGSRDSQSIGRAQGQSIMAPPNTARLDQQQTINAALGAAGMSGGDSKAFSDLLNMLNNSAQQQQQQQRQHVLPGNGGFNQNLPSGLSHQQSQSFQHLAGLGALGRHDSIESEEGKFVADNLVPGLRPRTREVPAAGHMANHIEESLPFTVNGPRLAPQPRMMDQRVLDQRSVDPRLLDQLFLNQGPAQYNAQPPNAGRNMPAYQQPQPLRAAPSPISNFNPVQQGVPQQRITPGLANLGGRPPHEPAQFVGGAGGNGLGLGGGANAGFGIQGGQGLHALPQAQNIPHQVPQQNFPGAPFQGGGAGNGMGMLNAQTQLRVPPPGVLGMGGAGVNGMNGMNGLDFRGGPNGPPPPNQMLGMGGPGVNAGGGMRNAPNFGNQLLGSGHLPPAAMGLRQQQPQQQQQQQHLPPPHIMQQMLGPQMQQHGIPGGQHNQAELMALLMNGNARE